MTCAALVAGNAVVLKPAEQTPAVAAVLVSALLESGLPPEVLSFLPGNGPDAGAPSSRTRGSTSSRSPDRATSGSASSRPLHAATAGAGRSCV